ncbi:hypothetical protein MJO28_010247 [Puccinia striiformis f. sp. tritici]|uniref:Uncharacterized protein n=1 Tax=Puccinia striiformis f. sp. tritici TaxID=168172 RepID=A0ACC0E4G6_9BASI|nr:hypothetical protein MJO28_010247 [Puccinia striiformis f. sp. tritici]
MVELWRNCNGAVSATSAGVAQTTRAKPVEPVVHSITSNPLIPSQPLPPHSPEPAAAQHNQPHPPQAVVHNNTQPQSISVGAAGLVEEEDEEDKEDVVDDQGSGHHPGRQYPSSNSTTEYKSLEQVDLKLPELVFAKPPKPSPIILLPANPSPRHGPRPNNQNRLPNPKKFSSCGYTSSPTTRRAEATQFGNQKPSNPFGI